ncbi:MAG: hypothetical protein L3J53_07900 [Proteobacteria bacterium]|nr:hypothetical protein [Pseudomonadota bacterium]
MFGFILISTSSKANQDLCDEQPTDCEDVVSTPNSDPWTTTYYSNPFGSNNPVVPTNPGGGGGSSTTPPPEVHVPHGYNCQIGPSVAERLHAANLAFFAERLLAIRPEGEGIVSWSDNNQTGTLYEFNGGHYRIKGPLIQSDTLLSSEEEGC